jgi:hypothetical protein
MHSAQSPGQTSLKFYRRLCGGGTSEHFFLTAFCSLPPSTLGLQHRLRPTTWVTAVAPGRGRSFYSCIYLVTGLLEEESSVLCMPGWIFRRRATASAMALFGLRLDSSMHLVEIVHLRRLNLCLVVWRSSSSPSTSGRGSSSSSIVCHGHSLTS